MQVCLQPLHLIGSTARRAPKSVHHALLLLLLLATVPLLVESTARHALKSMHHALLLLLLVAVMLLVMAALPCHSCLVARQHHQSGTMLAMCIQALTTSTPPATPHLLMLMLLPHPCLQLLIP